MKTAIGMDVERIESRDKVSGRAKYSGDLYSQGMLYAKLVTSKIAHGFIKSIDTTEALKIYGVKAVIIGKDYPKLTGVLIEDHPILAIDKVRYYGEPVAVVVALEEYVAAKAALLVKVDYQILKSINKASDAIKSDAPIIHEGLSSYTLTSDDIYPQKNSNIVSRYNILKGDMSKGWEQSEVIIEKNFYMPSTDHVAMETRTVKVEILSDETVKITSASQSPFVIKRIISKVFNIEVGNVHVYVPLVGGAFGGKNIVQLEILAYLASKSVGGRQVSLSNAREQDFSSSPCRLALEAKIKLGATKDGIIKAAQITYMLNTGAYADISPYMSKAIAVDCTGPYNIENLSCNSMCVYTNQNFSTSYRGFGHESNTFCIERAYDILALKCGIDPFEFRLKNCIKPKHFSPTQIEINKSNAGDIESCIQKLKTLIKWDEGTRIDIGNNKIRAKGISCLWKIPNTSTDASSAAFITFNFDGSINLNTGVVEMGSGGKTMLAQMLAEKFKMKFNRIHVKLEVDTLSSPQHWKTVASMTNYLAGNAVLKAAQDAIKQLKSLASILLRCSVEELEVENENVYMKSDPKRSIGFPELVTGIKFSDGSTMGGHVLGRGSSIMSHLTLLNEKTGKGKTGPAWTVGAQAVEVEFDTKEYTYRIVKAATVMDVGKLIDPKATQGIIRGGMSMGLSLASREEIIYDNQLIMQTTSLRNYKLLHFGQQPEYLIDFVETPQEDAPFKNRVFSEHGIIGMPAALANALSSACNKELNMLPLSPENIWRMCTNN